MTILPTFKTQRLILHGVTEADEPSYTKYFVDYDVIKELASTVPWPYPYNGVMNFIRHQVLPYQGIDKWVWGIYRKDNPLELIGAVDLWRKGSPEHRGFWLGKPFWDHGYMTEAVKPITDYAFGHLGFNKLVFANARGNVRSRRIKEKTGARLLYVQPKKYVNESYTEQEVWELTKEMWKSYAGKV